MSLNILIAPSGFKESLSVLDVTEAIAEGVRAVLPGSGPRVGPRPDRWAPVQHFVAPGGSAGRCAAGPTAPALGLFLEKVLYDEALGS